MLAPVCLFVYSRVAPVEKVVSALRNNYLASETDLFVFSDGSKGTSDIDQVNSVRAFVSKIEGFKSVNLHFRDVNYGLARSIIEGVTAVLETHGKVIVLEDDIVTSRNFLEYMNSALDFYSENKKIFAISGYSYPLRTLRESYYDNSFSKRSYSWGWATWTNRWDLVDWSVSGYAAFNSNLAARRKFNEGGSDLCRMLHRQMAGQIDSWMIRWVFTQYLHDMYDVFPAVSKVRNIGFGSDATHTKGSSHRFDVILDAGDSREFNFDPNPKLDSKVLFELRWIHSRFRRGFYKILNFFGG